MINFYKILDYDLKPDQQDSFLFAVKVLKQDINPLTTRHQALMLREKIVFHSSLKRAKDCIYRVPGVQYFSLAILKEIPFDISKLLTKNDFEKYGSSKIRSLFKTLFLADKLDISRRVIFSQFIDLSKLCLEWGVNNDIAVISHSFRLKVIQAILATSGELKNDPVLINKYLFDQQKTFDFGAGFSCNLNDLMIASHNLVE